MVLHKATVAVECENEIAALFLTLFQSVNREMLLIVICLIFSGRPSCHISEASRDHSEARNQIWPLEIPEMHTCSEGIITQDTLNT